MIPLKLEVEVAVPKLKDPVVKLPPIVIAEVAALAFMTFTDRVDALRTETFATEKFCVPDQVFEFVFTYVQKLFVHAVVAILVELSVFNKGDELIKGCEVNVATPFNVVAPLNVVAPVNVVAPLNVEVDVAVPIVTDPVVKFPPKVIAEVAELALIVFTFAVDIFKEETFTLEKD